jgi:hypothetical protein
MEDIEQRILLGILAEFGRDAVDIFRQELVNIDLPKKYPSGVDIGLYKSVAFNVSPKYEVTINMAPHWFWIQKGRRPKSPQGKNIGPKNPVKPSQVPPPFASILEWVAKKRRIQFRDRGTGKFLSFNQTAFIIRQGILKNGIAPKNFVGPAVESVENLWNEKTANEIFKGFIDVAGADFVRPRIRKTKNLKIIK